MPRADFRTELAVPGRGRLSRHLRPEVVALGPHLNLPEVPPQGFGRYLRPQVVVVLQCTVRNITYALERWAAVDGA